MIGTTVSHYKILEKLGGGAMGVVYKAQDTRLDRTVALKFLPPDLTQDLEARKRFIQEAKAASALQHNNICNIHDIEEAEDGQLFIVMDCYDGETLKKKIERGPLKLDEVCTFAIQIAQGLAEAHQHAIVHRDIKPANILITKHGVVKIVDFGLAKLVGASTLTKIGSTVGTVAYMSPEQMRGDQVDHRTDIWSLGVVFYEMLTGRRPFESDHEEALFYSILNQDPKPIRELRPEVPEAIEKICQRAMAKDSNDRYQTATEFLTDMESYKTGIRLSRQTRRILTKKRFVLYGGIGVLVVAIALLKIYYFTDRRAVFDRVAVLPFHNLSKDSTGEILADGMPWEIIENLQHVAALYVPSVRATMKFKGSQASYAEIARELGAKALVHGSILHVNNRIRIIASLIDPATDGSLWSESYDGNVEDILDLQSKIAQALVKAVRVEVTHDEVKRLTQSRKVDPQAYELYLKARRSFYNIAADEHEHAMALSFLERAIAVDSTFPAFYPFVVTMYQFGVFMGYYRLSDVIPRMQKAVETALLLDEQSSSSQMALGILDQVRWDWDGAEKALRRALEISPGDAQIHYVFTNLLLWRGRFEEAIAEMNRAYELDPSIDPHGFWMVASYVNARRSDEAVRLASKYLQQFPEDPALLLTLGYAYAQKGTCDSAAVYFEKSLQASAHDSYVEVICAQMYGICGQHQKARELLNDYLTNRKGRTIEPYNVAATYAVLRDTFNAYSWLERAYREQSQSLAGLRIDIAWDNQHSNPRYRDMLRKVRLDY